MTFVLLMTLRSGCDVLSLLLVASAQVAHRAGAGHRSLAHSGLEGVLGVLTV